MRFLALAITAIFLAACTTAPPLQQARPAPVAVQPVRQTGSLIGLTVDELAVRFGPPAFQVREGTGLKLQWSAPACVLDAFLYPPGLGSGALRVTYVEARRPSGAPTDQAGCIAAADATG
ncbi:MAG TPA: hypothetical protein VM913_09140 [Sphingomicrobium sp.]|nr:hypothetical protein [Sphingomicrobium sp.]